MFWLLGEAVRVRPVYRSLRLIGFAALEFHADMLAAGPGDEFGWPFLCGWSKAHLARLISEFVDSAVLIALASPFGHREVEGLGSLGGVDRARPAADQFTFFPKTPCAIRFVGCGVLAGFLIRHFVAIHDEGHDGPCALDLLAVFQDRLLFGCISGSECRNRHERGTDEEQAEE